ncbi:hypothetical protein [Halomonas smyrnensis]|uniref:hypothetical protein n=1 Tax=Halomonas smyrnensis TaxID=720605 RepID=UPI0012EA688E|nr:hypothetical protein [Halomonas smyrnensis]
MNVIHAQLFFVEASPTADAPEARQRNVITPAHQLSEEIIDVAQSFACIDSRGVYNNRQ